MSALEHDQVEAKSSIQITTTAKGDPQVTVKIREGVDEPEVARIRELAVAAYKQTRADVGWPIATPAVAS